MVFIANLNANMVTYAWHVNKILNNMTTSISSEALWIFKKTYIWKTEGWKKKYKKQMNHDRTKNHVTFIKQLWSIFTCMPFVA